MICSLFQESNIKPINTFTIGFDEKSHDESKYASEVAEMLKTKHNLKVISNNLDIEKIISAIENYDEPFAAPSLLPTCEVSSFTKSKSTVALSGDGGDELFMGYGYYSWFDRLKNINKNFGSLGFF